MGEGKPGWNKLNEYDFIKIQDIENKMAATMLQTRTRLW